MFKLLIISILAILPLSAQEVTIQKQKEFQIEYDPNLYKNTFSIKQEEHNIEDIEQNFQKIIQIAQESKICKGGKYNINPHYKEDRYLGYISFHCQFEKKQTFEKLLDKIKGLKGKLTQGQINLSNTENLSEDAQVELEREALLFPKRYSKFLESSLDQVKCSVTNISFSNSRPIISPYRMQTRAETKSTITPPVEDKVKYTLSTNYTFTCKQNL